MSGRRLLRRRPSPRFGERLERLGLVAREPSAQHPLEHPRRRVFAAEAVVPTGEDCLDVGGIDVGWNRLPEARTNKLRLAAVAAEIGGREPTLVLHQVIDLLAAAGIIFPVPNNLDRALKRLAVNSA